MKLLNIPKLKYRIKLQSYRVIKKSLVHLTIKVQKKHAKTFYTVSITYHDNVVRVRDNRWRYCELVSTVRRISKCLETGGGHFEHYL
jgi:ribosomal protein S26